MHGTVNIKQVMGPCLNPKWEDLNLSLIFKIY